MDWIEERTGELDAKEDVLQLDHRSGGSVLSGSYGDFQRRAAIPHATGNLTVAPAGIAAAMTLAEMSVNVRRCIRREPGGAFLFRQLLDNFYVGRGIELRNPQVFDATCCCGFLLTLPSNSKSSNTGNL